MLKDLGKGVLSIWPEISLIPNYQTLDRIFIKFDKLNDYFIFNEQSNSRTIREKEIFLWTCFKNTLSHGIWEKALILRFCWKSSYRPSLINFKILFLPFLWNLKFGITSCCLLVLNFVSIINNLIQYLFFPIELNIYISLKNICI